MIMFLQEHPVIDNDLRSRDFQIDNVIVNQFARLKIFKFQCNQKKSEIKNEKLTSNVPKLSSKSAYMLQTFNDL
jgi:hypothetical protein